MQLYNMLPKIFKFVLWCPIEWFGHKTSEPIGFHKHLVINQHKMKFFLNGSELTLCGLILHDVNCVRIVVSAMWLLPMSIYGMCPSFTKDDQSGETPNCFVATVTTSIHASEAHRIIYAFKIK